MDKWIDKCLCLIQCEIWMRAGSQLLIDTGVAAPKAKSPEEAEQLVKNLEKFVEEGKKPQEERLQKISTIATQLYGENLLLQILNRSFK